MPPGPRNDDGAENPGDGKSSNDAAGPSKLLDRVFGGRSGRILWSGLAVLMLVAKGGDAIDCFSPPRSLADFCSRDLSQDWISSRALLAGRPAYGSLRALVDADLGRDSMPPDAPILPYNAHPPGTFLVTLPLAYLDYRGAWIAWTVVSVIALLASVGLILREWTGRVPGIGLFPLLAFIATSHPFQDTIYHGQFNTVLLGLITAAWACLEKRPRLAGVLIGVAAVIKLFPGLLLLPLIGRRSGSTVLAAIASVALLGLASTAIVGPEGCRRYALEVAPSIGPDHGGAWGNQSLVGLYHKLFGDTRGRFRPLYPSLTVERVASLASIALVCSCAFAAGSIERGRGVASDHFGYMLTVVGLVVVNPVVWNHYFVLLILPMAWFFAIARDPIPKFAILALAAVLWLPRWTIWKFAAPGAVHDGRFDVVGPLATWTGLATQTYAVLLVYILLSWMSIRAMTREADVQGPASRR